MSTNFRCIFLSALAAAATAAPAFRDLVIHESRQGVPDGFIESGSAPGDQVLNLRLGLVSNNMAGLEEALYAVSTPDSAQYGQHLSKEDVEAFVRPDPSSTSLVNQFLASFGVNSTTISPAGDWLSISVPVSQASEMFSAEFSTFIHQETNQTSVRTLAYSIPAELQGHLNLVHPTITFENPFARLPVVTSPLPPSVGNLTSRQSVPASCDSIITPTCLLDLYGIPTTPATQSSSTLGVSGFIDQFANQDDLSTFLLNFRPDLDGSTFALQTLDDGENPQNEREAGIEANLDIQYTVGVASGVPTTFISVGDRFQDGALEGFLDIINFLLDESNPPHVLTTSYGQNENTISSNLANQLCNAYMQLGARGTSILFASGDGGVSGSQSGRCTTFLPTFPSGCPFMTSVGATTGIPETAASFSSGGFSNVFAQPSYQASAVSAYLAAIGNTNSGLFNAGGRAFPDVSAQGENVEIVLEQEGELVAGTSCASPIFASVISLINDRLVAAGKSPLGFLNPFLYSTVASASALNDITTGSNPGCNTNGFPARTGWDPVTGLGTPNFNALLAAAGL